MYVYTICVHPNGHLHQQNLLQKMTKIAAVAVHCLDLLGSCDTYKIGSVCFESHMQAKLIAVMVATLGIFPNVHGTLCNSIKFFYRLSINLKPTL